MGQTWRRKDICPRRSSTLLRGIRIRRVPQTLPRALEAITAPTLVLAADHDFVLDDHTLGIYHHLRNSELRIRRLSRYSSGIASSDVNGDAGRPAELYRFTTGAFAHP